MLRLPTGANAAVSSLAPRPSPAEPRHWGSCLKHASATCRLYGRAGEETWWSSSSEELYSL